MTYMLRRFMAGLMVLVLVSAVSFGLLYLGPADPALVIAAQRIGHPPSAADVAYIRSSYGLDQPLPFQYLRWLGQVLQGDLGASIRTGTPVAQGMQETLGPSLALAGATLLMTIAVGLPLGLLAALYADTWPDMLIRASGLLAVSLPNFWLAFLLILLFAVSLGWLPSYGMRGAPSFVLPVLTLGAANVARLAQLTRSLILEERAMRYVQTARAKGLAEIAIGWRHILPNIIPPLASMLALQVGSILTGVVIIEGIFAWPGIGGYYLKAITFRDVPVIQALTLFFGAVFVGVNLLADLIHARCDPRARLS